MTDAEIITSIGQIVWGRRWAQDMARILAVDRSTVYAWRDGKSTPRVEVWGKLERAISGNIAALIKARSSCRSRARRRVRRRK